SAQIAVNSPNQNVTWSQTTADDLSIMRAGTVEQPVLAKTGDNLRIDWGYLYVAVPLAQPRAHAHAQAQTQAREREQRAHALKRPVQSAIGQDVALRAAFVKDGSLPSQSDARMPRAADSDAPVLAATLSLGRVQQTPVSRHLLVAYDDEWAIEYFEQRLRPWWRRDGKDAQTMLREAAGDYAHLVAASERFDEGLMRDLRALGGEPYARIGALAFRQALAAHKLVAHSRS